ncbi:MAG TPA: organomercurial lyase [Gemmatimonadaceae bacterium]
MTRPAADDGVVRQAIYEAFAAGGAPPTRADIAERAALPPARVSASYERLAEARVLVLDAGTREVMMAMPFSAVPTAFRVRAADRAWWANCAWDAFGIAAATGCDVDVETACADCGESMTVAVRAGAGAPLATAAVAHFAVPAARWWEDIGFT